MILILSSQKFGFWSIPTINILVPESSDIGKTGRRLLEKVSSKFKVMKRRREVYESTPQLCSMTKRRRMEENGILSKIVEKRIDDDNHLMFIDIGRSKRRKLLYGYGTIDNAEVQMRSYLQRHQSRQRDAKFVPCDLHIRWCVINHYRNVNRFLKQCNFERVMRNNTNDEW